MPSEAELIMRVFYWASTAVGIFAFFHALMQRPDAYAAIDRLTKPAWLGITGGAVFALLLASWNDIWMFWVAGLVAALVYIVDIRPRLIEVQRGQKW